MRRLAALHAQNLVGAVGRIARQPFSTAMTVLVIAIAIALPAGMRVVVENVAELSGTWESAADFSVYLALGVTEERARALADEIGARPDVGRAMLITSAEALDDFRARSGFGEALDALGENPLPHTIVVRPARGAGGDVEAIAEALRALPDVDLVQLDTEWVARLRAILALASRVAGVATAVLGLGVVLVIGNTIRLEINNRSTEIEVMKLVGATDGFIRRPFLYLGFCYGLAGAAVAALLVAAALLVLRAPAVALADLYGSNFRPAGLTLAETGVLLGGGAFLGWAGALLATARHLRAIEPR
ncbi:MAG TPA: permease-like cell division protein FtsX [Gammaproteobacteria bacterium]